MSKYINELNIDNTVYTIQDKEALHGDSISLTSENIEDGSITNNKLANNAVSNQKILNNAISTDKIADEAITNSKIADNAIDTQAIMDEAVEAAKIAALAVITEKLADNAVTTDKIADEAVTTDKIADASIGTDQLTQELRDSISRYKLQGGQVTGTSIGTDQNGSTAQVKIEIERNPGNNYVFVAATSGMYLYERVNGSLQLLKKANWAS